MYQLNNISYFIQFVSERDSCRERLQKPVFRIKTEEGDVWPLVVLQQGELLLSCLTLVPAGHTNNDHDLVTL